eukprot:102256_1
MEYDETMCEDDETMEFSTCGACDITCDNLIPICGLKCTRKCQCKSDTPIYDPVNKKCITEDECTPATTAEDDDKTMEYDETMCEDDETMEFSTCGACDITCDNLNPICVSKCTRKCHCKSDTPIYDPVNKKCITQRECTPITANICEDDATMEFSTCSACDITCDNLNPICGLKCTSKCQCKKDTPIYDAENKKFPICGLKCTSKCQCKKDTPIYDAENKKCITQDECTSKMTIHNVTNWNNGLAFFALLGCNIIVIIYIYSQKRQKMYKQVVDMDNDESEDDYESN